MINYIWFALLAVGILAAAVLGKMEALTAELFSAASMAVEISLGLIGVMALWLGLMKVAEQAGAVRLISRLLHPLLSRLFPGIPKGHPALGSIVANLAANMLGLGNSATALGLRAMQDLQEVNPEKDTATDDMCVFLAINTSSVTLIPATVIAVRAANGSSAPAEIVGTVIFATSISTLVAVAAAKILQNFSRKRRGKV